jgi:RimJ/RimL family protein N-acetyltransferase
MSHRGTRVICRTAHNQMASDPSAIVSNWRSELPTLAGAVVTLREPEPRDLGAILEILSAHDATRFGIDDPISDPAVHDLIERAARDRAAGTAVTYAVAVSASRIVGLLQIRQLDPSFEAAEWECTIAPSARGTGIFVEAARLAASFAFGTIGVHRLEARVLLQNGRANEAARKIGAVQEGVLRRSARRSGEYFDQVLWSLLKEDWGERRVSTAPRVH